MMKNKGKAALGVGGLGAAIALIITSVVDVEGGYVNDPNDSGGATKFGITERVARANGYQGPMSKLTRQTAVDIYAGQYVRKVNFDAIVEVDRSVGKKVIDIGVNAGPSRAARWFQMSLNDYNRRQKDYRDIKVDGDVGPASINAFRALQRKRGVDQTCDLMIKKIEAYQGAHYSRIGQNNGKNETFQIGWFTHRIGNVQCD